MAAATPPSSGGIERARPHPTASMTRIRAPPRARLRRGTAASQRAWRTGSSTQRIDSAARPSEMPIATAAWCHAADRPAPRRNHHRPVPQVQRVRVRAEPLQAGPGEQDRRRPRTALRRPRSRGPTPATITAIVASTGTRTAVPGHGIASWKRKQARPMTASPAHADAARTPPGSPRPACRAPPAARRRAARPCASAGGRTPTTAPAASARRRARSPSAERDDRRQHEAPVLPRPAGDQHEQQRPARGRTAPRRPATRSAAAATASTAPSWAPK